MSAVCKQRTGTGHHLVTRSTALKHRHTQAASTSDIEEHWTCIARRTCRATADRPASWNNTDVCTRVPTARPVSSSASR